MSYYLGCDDRELGTLTRQDKRRVFRGETGRLRHAPNFMEQAVGAAFEDATMRTLEKQTIRLPRTWTTKERETIPIMNMTNSHLRSTIQMLRRNTTAKIMRRMFSSPDDPFFGVGIEPGDIAYMTEDGRAEVAWGEVYVDLIEEALFRSDDGDIDRWLAL
jgi:hypothetical protein